MLEGFLWAVDHHGQAHTISTSEQVWQLRTDHFLGHRLGFKQITAGKHSAWGLSIDWSLYVYVYASEVNIRYLEFTYENQRWTPIRKFSERGLLFTDPPAFSNEKGTQKRPRPSEIKLPNEHWQWEGEWRVDSNFHGETAGGGWQYGSRFNHPERFYPQKHLTSWIRRRKWIRYRRYIATERWAKVPGVYPNHTDPPLMYLAAGGSELPGQPAGYMSLWVVTTSGKLFCRVGINHKHPEGESWREVSLPPKVGVVQVSVSPTGIVWAVTDDGIGLVRTQVSREYPLGLGWEFVDPPENQLLSQVSMGMNAIWALTKDNVVWFRQGFDLMLSITDRKALTGSHWIKMPGRMLHLSIGPNDQVWAISYSDHLLYMRGAVTYEELSGRSWKLINVTDKVDRSLESPSALNSSDGQGRTTSDGSRSVSNDFLSPPSSALFSPLSPMSFSQVSESYLSLIVPDRSSSLLRNISFSETFARGGKHFRNFSCQTVDMHTAGSASSCETLNSIEQFNGSHLSARAVVENVLRRSMLKEDDREETIPRLDRSQSCDVLLSNSGIEDHVAPRRHSVSDFHLSDELGATGVEQDLDDDTFLFDKAEDHIVSPIKSFATLRRQASWSSYDSEKDDKICNFAEPSSGTDSDSDDGSSKVRLRSVETQTDMLNVSGNSETSLNRTSSDGLLSQGNEDRNFQFDQDRFFDDSGSNENLMERAVFDHFQRDTLKRRMSQNFSLDATRDHSSTPYRSLPNSSSSPEVGAPHLGPLNQNSNYSTRISYVNQFYLEEPDPLLYRYEDYDDEDSEADLLWVWVCGGSCWVKPTSLPKWFKHCIISQASFKHRLKEGAWRDSLLKSLKERKKNESDQYGHYLSAVDMTPWVKKGSIQWQSDGRKRPWLDSTVELEKCEDRQKQRSKLTIICNMYGRDKKIKLPISDITCVLEVSNSDKPTFSVHTAKTTEERKPVKLRVRTEGELRDWLVALSLACTDVQDIPATPGPYSMWCTTCRGDIFYHQTRPNTETALANTMYWQQIGGHLHVIESCPAGVTWGIGMDHAVWVHSGGYGGGIFKGVYSSTSGIHEQTDTTKIYLYENQRWSALHGFSERSVKCNRRMDSSSLYFNTGFSLLRHELWMQESGKIEQSKDTVSPPSAQWQWASEWQIDFSVKGSTDKEGWQYARDFKSGRTFHKEKRWNDSVRRRRWIRTCQLVTTGPWRRAQGLHLVDISLQVDTDVSWDGPIAVWALGTNGDVMTRIGVTRHNPLGSSWFHVPTDQPFQSISVGGKHRVWGIGKDGSAFFRNGINIDNVTGNAWFHVTAPSVAPLKQISVGATMVWAVDAKKNLWFRQDVTPNFPEGTRWILVSPKVRQVSVGPQDQVWMLADAMDNAKGVICRREGISPSLPQGKHWDKGAGGGILHLSVRGCRPVPLDRTIGKQGKTSNGASETAHEDAAKVDDQKKT